MSAVSMMSGRLVAPMMNTLFLLCMPSISVSSWFITRSPAPLSPELCARLRPLAKKYRAALIVLLAGVLLLAYVLLWLTPLWETVDRKYYGAPFGRYAKAFGIGFAMLAGVPLAAILLFISNVGMRLALIVLFLYAAAIIAAPVFLGFFLGALLWRGAMKKAPCYYAELAIGILVWRVAASVPGLSFAVGLVSVPLGLGVVTLLLGKGAAKPSPKAETACEESAASDPAVLPEDSDSAEQ